MPSPLARFRFRRPPPFGERGPLPASIEPGSGFSREIGFPLGGIDVLMIRNQGVAMTSSTVPGLKSRKAGPGKTDAKLGPGRLTRMLVVETVPDTGLDIRLCASKTECAALADDYGLVAVQTFETGFHVRKQGPKRYKVSGVLHALVTQTCGISLEPFETLVTAPVDADFAPSGQPLGAPAGRKMTVGGAATIARPQDPADPIINGQIDLGALAAEFLALNLELYPRKPGVIFADTNVGGEASRADSPFAVLRHQS
ncbi:MAG: YceD family protein [Methylocella sp.]